MSGALVGIGGKLSGSSSLSGVLMVRPLLARVGARHGLSPREHRIVSLDWPRGALTLSAATNVATRLEWTHPLANQLVPTVYWVVGVGVLLPWILGPWLLRGMAKSLGFGGGYPGALSLCSRLFII